MKRVLLLMVVSALLGTLGFAQTPDTGSNTDQAIVKGCLAGSEGNFTVAEDGTRQIFKITTSSVDLKPHLGQAVKLIGHRASGAVSSGAADNSFAVTEVNMISEHCATAAAASAASAATVSPSSATVSTPTVDAAAPAATVNPSSPSVSTPTMDAAAPAATVSPSSPSVSTPPSDAAAPAATVNPSSPSVSTPASDAAAPAATVSPSSETVSPPAADAGHPTRRSAHPHRLSATHTAAAATVSPSSETVSPPAADAATPAATAASSETVGTPAAAASTPTVTHSGRSLSLLISFGVLVIVFATVTPFLLRWRKRKILERTDTPNLSLTNEASSDRDKAEPRKVA